MIRRRLVCPLVIDHVDIIVVNDMNSQRQLLPQLRKLSLRILRIRLRILKLFYNAVPTMSIK
jgi:hypothetical protein